ncbi:hypothetical protein WS62_19940 [Burkholderia sp. ABCPW 14]|nr:hypothetical protein WS62_19940 [Burkholderia sp. ABCPW 14]
MSAASAARISASTAFERTPGSFSEPISDAAALPKRRTSSAPGILTGGKISVVMSYWKFSRRF